MNRTQIMFLAIPTILLAVVKLVAPTQDFIVYILVIWFVLNIAWLKPKLDLISQYNLLMKLLEELSSTKSKSSQTILEVINHPSFEQMQRNVDRNFNELNKKSSSMYRLLYPNTVLIKKKFVELVEDTKTLYEEFTYIVKSENIPDNRFDCNLIKKKYEAFIFKLNQPEFIEIKNTIPEKLLFPPSLPPLPIPYSV